MVLLVSLLTPHPAWSLLFVPPAPQFACRLDSNLLFGALSSLNTAVIRDVER
jgi:hypothetical protein